MLVVVEHLVILCFDLLRYICFQIKDVVGEKHNEKLLNLIPIYNHIQYIGLQMNNYDAL